MIEAMGGSKVDMASFHPMTLHMHKLYLTSAVDQSLWGEQ